MCSHQPKKTARISQVGKLIVLSLLALFLIMVVLIWTLDKTSKDYVDAAIPAITVYWS